MIKFIVVFLISIFIFIPAKPSFSKEVSQISGGQRQRVAIARLLRQQAQLILADEPLSNLDPILSENILELLLSKGTSSPIQVPDTYLISLHKPELINNFSRVVGLKEGKIFFDLPSEKVTANQLHQLYERR